MSHFVPQCDLRKLLNNESPSMNTPAVSRSRRLAITSLLLSLGGVPGLANAGLKEFFGGNEKKAADLARAAENGSVTALETLKSESNAGNKLAALQFGFLHHTGKLASGKDVPLAMKAYRIAVGNVGGSDQITGNALAAYNMGLIHLWGEHNGGTPEPQEALRWFLAAAGDESKAMLPAVMHVAALYEMGLGAVKADLKEAMRWYRLAATMREPIAQFRLGKALVEGIGLDKNPFEGMLQIKYATDKWHRAAMYYLATIYANGTEYQEAVPYEAAKWLYIASTGDDRYKQAADKMIESLPGNEHARVIKAARLWISGHLKLPPKIEYNLPLNVEPPSLPGVN